MSLTQPHRRSCSSKAWLARGSCSVASTGPRPESVVSSEPRRRFDCSPPTTTSGHFAAQVHERNRTTDGPTVFKPAVAAKGKDRRTTAARKADTTPTSAPIALMIVEAP